MDLIWRKKTLFPWRRKTKNNLFSKKMTESETLIQEYISKKNSNLCSGIIDLKSRVNNSNSFSQRENRNSLTYPRNREQSDAFPEILDESQMLVEYKWWRKKMRVNWTVKGIDKKNRGKKMVFKQLRISLRYKSYRLRVSSVSLKPICEIREFHVWYQSGDYQITISIFSHVPILRAYNGW